MRARLALWVAATKLARGQPAACKGPSSACRRPAHLPACRPQLPAGKTLGFLLPLVMRVRALRKEAEEAAAAAGAEEEQQGGEGGEGGAAAAAPGGVQAVVVR